MKGPRSSKSHTLIQTFSSAPIHLACGHSAVGGCPGNHCLSTLANPRDNDSHSPQLGEVVQGLPQSQHLSAGHEGFLWAFQYLLQLHLGEQQAVGGGGRAAVSTRPKGLPSFLGWDSKGAQLYQSSPEPPAGRMTTNVVALATPLDHSLSPCLGFSILCANVQSALLNLSASTLLIHLSPGHSLSCPTHQNTVQCGD